jgi:hypothetical protein
MREDKTTEEFVIGVLVMEEKVSGRDCMDFFAHRGPADRTGKIVYMAPLFRSCHLKYAHILKQFYLQNRTREENNQV